MADKLRDYYVSLYTWGTHPEGGNGMAHYMDTALLGGNVGHAALELTLPANNETEALIAKYCMKNGEAVIPFERTTQGYYDDNGQAKHQDVFKVYFSWWPNTMHANINDDNVHERAGVDVGQIDGRFTDAALPGALVPREERTAHGMLGSRTVTLSDNEIAHISSLTALQKNLIIAQRELHACKDKIDAVKILKQKLINKNTLQVEGTILKLLDTYIPNWKDQIPNSASLRKVDIEAILAKIQLKETELNDAKIVLQGNCERAKVLVQDDRSRVLEAEIQQIRGTLSLLAPDAQKEAIRLRDPHYSKEAWLEYELREVRAAFDQAQSITFLCNISFKTHKDEILGMLFDRNYPAASTLNQAHVNEWRKYLAPQFHNVTREEMSVEILTELRKAAIAQKTQSLQRQKVLEGERPLYVTKDNFLRGDYQNFITRGKAPDSKISLPIGGLKMDEHNKLGLNGEAMLKRMRELKDDAKKFDLMTKNCSATTGSILAAGAEPSLRSYFEQKAWGGFGNPQQVYNNAAQYERSILTNEGKKSFWETLSSWNPLNVVSWLGGKMLSKLVEPSTHPLARVGLGLLLIPVGAAAIAVETLKAVCNPMKAFSNCSQFIKFAWENDSKILKACSIPVAFFAGAIAIPAGLQTIVQKAIINPIASLFTTAPPIEKDLRPRVPLNKDLIVQIEENDADRALAKLSNLLREQPDKIPVFTAKTQEIVSAQLNTLDKRKPENAAKLDLYERTVKEIYQKANAKAAPPAAVVDAAHEAQVPAPAQNTVERHPSNPRV